MTGGRDTFVPVETRWYVSNLGGVITTGLLARFTGRRLLRLTFWGAVALHVTEAAYSYRAARKAGFTESAPKWALQTLAVGFPSLQALHAARNPADAGVSGELGPER